MSTNARVPKAVDGVGAGESSGGWRDWSAEDASIWIAAPTESDDKYSRGVLGVVTGSDLYPGAAVLGVEAAVRTGVGMVRYVGAGHPTELVLQRRPETVTGTGRVQAWLVGSGMDANSRPEDDSTRLRAALADGVPIVIDAGALDLIDEATGPVVITPHFRELATVLAAKAAADRPTPDRPTPDAPTPDAPTPDRPSPDAPTSDAIEADPARWAVRAAEILQVTVLLKGHTTYIADPDGTRLRVTAGTAWLATAGSGDVLGGVLGALVATHARALSADRSALARLAATAAFVHGRAGERASAGGPIAALDIAEALPGSVAELLS
jgi:ADP-dependent NAD(P)H-hydrate dehydratase / NAD(P)H-hydrate epimerase